MTVRVAKNRDDLVFSQPVDGLIWKGSVDRGIAAVEYQIEGVAEVVRNRLQGWKICVDI